MKTKFKIKWIDVLNHTDYAYGSNTERFLLAYQWLVKQASLIDCIGLELDTPNCIHPEANTVYSVQIQFMPELCITMSYSYPPKHPDHGQLKFNKSRRNTEARHTPAILAISITANGSMRTSAARVQRKY